MTDDIFGENELKQVLALAETPHPLIDGKWDLLSREPRSTDFILSGWVPTGLCTFAGDSGTGKTSAVFPMALAAAGLIRNDKGAQPPPHERRKVIYHTEDVGQLKRMVELLRSEGLIEGDVDEWLMVVEAKRLTVDEYLKGFDGSQLLPYNTTCYRNNETLELAPLIVFDTYQECFALNDENNNSEVGEGIVRLKQTLKDFTDGVWIVAHTAKGSRQGRIRGASAIEGVVNQTFKVLRRGKQLFMELGKKRSDLSARRMVLRAYTGPVKLTDRWGCPKPERVTVSFLDIPTKEEEAAAQNDKVELLWSSAEELLKDGPLGKTERVKALGGNKAATIKAVNGWLEGGKLAGRKVGQTERLSLPD